MPTKNVKKSNKKLGKNKRSKKLKKLTSLADPNVEKSWYLASITIMVILIFWLLQRRNQHKKQEFIDLIGQIGDYVDVVRAEHRLMKAKQEEILRRPRPAGVQNSKNFSEFLPESREHVIELPAAQVDISVPQTAITSALQDLKPITLPYIQKLPIFQHYNPQLQPHPSHNFFYFHTKMPKCGSTTLKTLLQILKVKNNFNFMTLESGDIKDSQTSVVPFLQNSNEFYLARTQEKPLLIMKHHTFINLTASHLPQPTLINVVRNPIDRYISSYFFCRNGSNGMPTHRGKSCTSSSKNLKNPSNAPNITSIEDFFQYHLQTKKRLNTQYLEWFCGEEAEERCNNKKGNEVEKYGYAKNIILRERRRRRIE